MRIYVIIVKGKKLSMWWNNNCRRKYQITPRKSERVRPSCVVTAYVLIPIAWVQGQVSAKIRQLVVTGGKVSGNAVRRAKLLGGEIGKAPLLGPGRVEVQMLRTVYCSKAKAYWCVGFYSCTKQSRSVFFCTGIWRNEAFVLQSRLSACTPA